MPVKTKPISSPLRRPRLDEDVIPYTECRRTLADCMAKTRRTHRPILITQNGQAASLLLDVSDFEKTFTEVESLREQAKLSLAEDHLLREDIAIGLRELDEGKGIPNDIVFSELLGKFKS